MCAHPVCHTSVRHNDSTMPEGSIVSNLSKLRSVGRSLKLARNRASELAHDSQILVLPDEP
jgi:hypothetical protein